MSSVERVPRVTSRPQRPLCPLPRVPLSELRHVNFPGLGPRGSPSARWGVKCAERFLGRAPDHVTPTPRSDDPSDCPGRSGETRDSASSSCCRPPCLISSPPPGGPCDPATERVTLSALSMWSLKNLLTTFLLLGCRSACVVRLCLPVTLCPRLRKHVRGAVLSWGGHGTVPVCYCLPGLVCLFVFLALFVEVLCRSKEKAVLVAEQRSEQDMELRQASRRGQGTARRPPRLTGRTEYGWGDPGVLMSVLLAKLTRTKMTAGARWTGAGTPVRCDLRPRSWRAQSRRRPSLSPTAV